LLDAIPAVDDFLRKIISSLVVDAMLEQDMECLRSDNCMLCTIREGFRSLQ
jgi:hypothetical protein